MKARLFLQEIKVLNKNAGGELICSNHQIKSLGILMWRNNLIRAGGLSILQVFLICKLFNKNSEPIIISLFSK
jgi:hypothetical protein